MALNKQTNGYVRALEVEGRTGEAKTIQAETGTHTFHLSDGLYEDTPKAVWAAIAISALTCGGDHMSIARQRIVTEWDILHTTGIVPQAVPSKHRRLVDRELHSGINDDNGE